MPRSWGCWPPSGTRNTAVGSPGLAKTSLWRSVRPQQPWERQSQVVHGPVSEEETEAQARSLLSAGSLCGAVLLTWAIWVAWDELEGVGLEAPAARPVHSHLAIPASLCLRTLVAGVFSPKGASG